jgi:YbbR domain-containing protein
MRMLTENLAWKLFALALATGLWWATAGEGQLAMSVPAAVQYRNVPQDLELIAEPIDQLFLKVKGPTARLRAPSLAETTVVLDLTNADRPGDQTFTLGPGNLTLPPGVALVRVAPSQVRVRLERRATKEVPVEVRFVGPPPAGYRISYQSTNPQRVRITGPESRLEQIASVETDPVDLASRIGTTEFRVHPYISDPLVRFESEVLPISVKVALEKIP